MHGIKLSALGDCAKRKLPLYKNALNKNYAQEFSVFGLTKYSSSNKLNENKRGEMPNKNKHIRRKRRKTQISIYLSEYSAQTKNI
jgi:hypothetical protein